MKYRVTWDGLITPTADESDDDVETFIDALMDALFQVEGEDQDVTASIARRTVSMSITVVEQNPEAAAELGGSMIRCAIHAAGGATPGWENSVTVQADPDFAVNVQNTRSELVAA